LETIQIPSANGTNETATQFLQDAVGITFFVPNDAAFTSVVNQTISSLQNNVSALAAVLEKSSASGTNETATQFLQDAVGITFFVPNDAAFTSVVNQTISSLQNNMSALAAVLENHVSLLSPSLKS
jgi:uncharacterized surface protein with fasciclin (FAS1) repeats